jgi:hypothetical protein
MMGVVYNKGLCPFKTKVRARAKSNFVALTLCIPSSSPSSLGMPSERYAVVEFPYHVQENITTQPQAKLCAYCHATLVDATTAFHDNQVICAICRERPHPNTRDSSYPHRQRSHEVLNVSNTRRVPDPIPTYDTTLTEPPSVCFFPKETTRSCL